MSGTRPLNLYRPRASTPSEVKAVVRAARDLAADLLAIVQQVEAALSLTDADALDLSDKTGQPPRFREDVLKDATTEARRHAVGLLDQLAFVPLPPSSAPRLGRGRQWHNTAEPAPVRRD